MDASDTARKVQVAAYGLLAGGFVLSAYATWKGGAAASKSSLDKASLGQPEPIRALPSGKRAKKKLGPPKTKNYDVTDIDDRVALIGDLVRKGSLNSNIREATIKLVSQTCDRMGRIDPNGDRYCVPEKNCIAEVRAIFDAVRNPRSKYRMRYVRDAILADVFVDAERSLMNNHGGDCDDYSIAIGSMLMSIAHPVRLRVIATRRRGVADADAPWAHIYLLTPTKFDDPNAKWIAVDGSMDKPLGWEAPGASEVARTGKGAGIVARVRDYSVVQPAEVA